MASEQERVLAILTRYYLALEDGSAGSLYADPCHAWRYYTGDMTMERMRRGITDLDAYLSAGGQKNWAQTHWGVKQGIVFDDGPELGRLPDSALMAMFQEIDAVLGEAGSQAAH